MDSIIIDKRLTGVPWKCPDCGSERCPESFEMSLTDNPLNPFFSAKKTSVPELLIYEILQTKKICFFCTETTELCSVKSMQTKE